ncbi:MAG: GNAT family N-acetyltransferase [Hyphomonas sp.]|jgi:RimJ/RimL family protein N-acetyltransferase|nr:GNAT family N-acetyltransferase [Henriciella sp.]MBO6694951.1 GNAT family N-acetyltransferase [Henriciella sp.]MCR9224978.1 GNAT family N-acetyltransferase [Hyphomonas sp.]
MSRSFEFRSERFLMRPPVAQDARQIACCVNDAEMARNLARLPYPYAPGDALDWIAYADQARERGSEYAFVITHAEAGVIGSVGFNRTSGEAWEIGYWVDKAVQGRGVATEAARALIAWGEAEFGVTSFIAGHFQDNPASGRVLGKLGFERVGEKMMFSQGRGGRDAAWRYALSLQSDTAIGAAG